MKRRFAILALLTLTVAGCDKKPAVPNVTAVSENDPQMNAAMDKARSTVKSFIAVLQSPKANQTGFSVKMPLVDGRETEHMWLARVSYDGTNFHGTITGQPVNLKNVKRGQKVSVAPAKISDWMYIENRKLVGGETLRALRDGLPAEERAEFDKNLPFVVE